MTSSSVDETTTSTVRYDVSDGVARLTLARPAEANAVDLPTARAASAQSLAQCVSDERAQSTVSALPPAAVTTHADPMAALHAALAAADPADRIVIFGSFYTVGGVLHDGLPRLNAPHLPGAATPAPGH